MDLESEVIDVDDSDVEFIGEEEVISAAAQAPSASVASPTTNKNIKNQQQPSVEPKVEAMDTDDILPKTNQS